MHETDSHTPAEDIEDGTYYLRARHWYSEIFHMPIAERSYYVIIIVLAIINGFFALESFFAVFPIKPTVPFVVTSNDVWEDWPRIRRLTTSETENKNAAVMHFLVENYVQNRESYDLSLYELRYRNIWSQSAPQVFDSYKTLMDASNPYSPYRLYTNQEKRIVTVLSVNTRSNGPASQAEVVFEATVRRLSDDRELRHSKWRATIAFAYTDFVVDQTVNENAWLAHAWLKHFGLTENAATASGDKRKVIPMTFMVSDYQVKELLE